jgi:hypothetical protein
MSAPKAGFCLAGSAAHDPAGAQRWTALSYRRSSVR